MTKTYVFSNKGVLDPRSITTFGVSSKESNNPIGMFGTGLKYAIAVTLRLGGSISIHSGGQVYEFGKQSVRVRVNNFDIVTMNGQELGFTTELGKTWEPWQAFRELICNTMDEGGTAHELYDQQRGYEADETVIYLTGDVFESVWAERDKIVLDTTREPLFANDKVQAFPGKSEWLYYRGVRVQKLTRPSLYTYNFLRKMELTEDRTFKYDFLANEAVVSLIQTDLTDKSILAHILTAPTDTSYEGRLYFSSHIDKSPEFEAEALRLAESSGTVMSHSARDLVREKFLARLMKSEKLDLDLTETQRLVKVKKFLGKMGYAVGQYEILITENLGVDVLGRAIDDKIYISKRVLMMGSKMLAGTILEEYLHLKHGLVDESRGMQNFLVDALISAGERSTRTVL